MTAIQYADAVLHDFRRGKKAKSLAKGDTLEVLITCADDSVERVTGYWASEIMSRLKEETKNK